MCCAGVEAALQAWSRFGPAHPDPAAEYARLKPSPPKKPALNTLDRFFAKRPKVEGGGQGEAAGAAAGQVRSPAAGAAGGSQQAQQLATVLAGGQQRAEQHQQEQQQGQQGQQAEQQQGTHRSGAGQGGSGGVPGSAGGGPADAFQAMLAAARQQRRPGSGSPGGRPAGGASGGGAGGDGGPQPRHTWRAAGQFTNSLVKIAERPDRQVPLPGLYQ